MKERSIETKLTFDTLSTTVTKFHKNLKKIVDREI